MIFGTAQVPASMVGCRSLDISNCTLRSHAAPRRLGSHCRAGFLPVGPGRDRVGRSVDAGTVIRYTAVGLGLRDEGGGGGRINVTLFLYALLEK